MTVEQILRDIDEHDLSCSFIKLRYGGRWSGSIGAVENMRLADTFEAAVLAAWAAYTNAEGK